MSGQLSWPDDPKDALAVEGRPKHVWVASILMYVGAALALPALIQLLLTPRSDLESSAREALKRAKQEINAGNVDAWINNLTMLVIAATAVSVVLWVLMGLLNARGKRWARTLATGLAGLNVMWMLFNLLNGTTPSVVELASLAVGLTAAGLLWTPQSRQWFAGKNRRV